MKTRSSYTLCEWLSGRHSGPEHEWSGIATLAQASVHDVSFCDDATQADTQAGILLTRIPDEQRTCIVLDDPKLSFILLMQRLFPVEQGGYIAPSATIDSSAFIHATATIHAGTVIMANCHVGAHCVLFPNVVLYPDTHLEEHCIIHAGAIIGADGFSYHPTPNGTVKVPQRGSVRLKSGVEVGANSTIDRAFLGETVIGKDSKLDNLVHIGHNCTLGESVLVAAQTGLSGSVNVGSATLIGGQVGIVEHTTIGPKVRIGAQSGVTRDVEAGETILGTPAEPAMKMKRIYASLRKTTDD